MDSKIQPANHAAGLARALSKLGFCSRSQAVEAIGAGRVKVNGTVRRDPQWRVRLDRDRIEVDGEPVRGSARVYVMLNKPRGLVTTASDEKGRATVFECLERLPFVAPVGRLDRASEGLLLFTNDTAWAAKITDPANHVEKTYHVQIDRLADEALLGRMREGVEADSDEIVQFCRGNIAHYKIPRYVRFVAAFPMTITGKVQKFRLREPYWSGRDRQVN